jgi:hypothetical protein
MVEMAARSGLDRVSRFLDACCHALVRTGHAGFAQAREFQN